MARVFCFIVFALLMRINDSKDEKKGRGWRPL
jgi:hypothetical protein